MEPYWQSIKKIIRESDVILEILDSRLIEISRNKELERILKESNRPVIVVVNKSDLVSRESLEKSIDKLKEETGKEVVYISSKKRNTIRNLLLRIKKVFYEHGKHEKEMFDKFTPKTERKHRIAKADIVVGVVGYPNVGKSSIINALSFKKKAKVEAKAGTTHGIHWIRATDEIKFIDTPGVIPLERTDDIKLSLIGARNIEKIKEKDVAAAKIIEMFLNTNKKALEDFYKVPIKEDLNCYEALEEIGRKKGHLKKGAEVDDQRTSIMIMRDWQQGKLKL